MLRCTAIIALIALLLGAISTFAVAWGIAMIRPNGSGSIAIPNWHFATRQGVIYWCANSDSAGHSIFALESQDPVQYQQWRDQSNAPQQPLSEFEPKSWVTIPVSDPGFLYVSNTFGWPVRAIRGLVIEGRPTASRPATVFKDYWIFGHPDDPRTIALPLRIIWPGFLISALTFAAAWLAILLAARRTTRALITRRRLRRGLCPACRYNLVGDFSSGCPECGWNRAGAPRST